MRPRRRRRASSRKRDEPARTGRLLGRDLRRNRLDQRRSAPPRRRRRTRPALDHGAPPNRRPRPAGQGMGLARRQPDGDAALSRPASPPPKPHASPSSRRSPCTTSSRACVARRNVRVKWPNDVLGRRQEGRRHPAGVSGQEGVDLLPWFAVGIGVNLAHAPGRRGVPRNLPRRPWRSRPAPPKRSQSLRRPGKHDFVPGASSGFAAIREAWLAVAAGLGNRDRGTPARRDAARTLRNA